MLPSIVQLPLFDNKPLPLLVAQEYNFPLFYHEIDGVIYYLVQDWIKGVTGSNNARIIWSKFQKRLAKEESELLPQWIQLPYKATNGKTYQMDFSTDKNLYHITEKLDVESDLRNKILDYLARAGAFADKVRINPEEMAMQALDYAKRKEISALINEGFTPDEAEQWVANRIEQKMERKITVSEWGKRGVKGREFGRLTNEVTSVAIGQSARELKEEMGITDSLRDHLSTAQNVAIKITEFTSRMLHIGRNSEGVEELTEDIKDTRPIIDAARPEIERAFSKKPRRLKGQDQPKLLGDE